MEELYFLLGGQFALSAKKLLQVQTLHLKGRGSASIFSSVQLSPCFANPLRLETDQTQDFINVNIKKIKPVKNLLPSTPGTVKHIFIC